MGDMSDLIAHSAYPASPNVSATRVWRISVKGIEPESRSSLSGRRHDGLLHQVHPGQERAGRNIDKLESELSIGLFVDAFEAHGVLQADPAGCGRLHEAEAAHEEDVWLVDPVRDDTLDLLGQQS